MTKLGKQAGNGPISKAQQIVKFWGKNRCYTRNENVRSEL